MKETFRNITDDTQALSRLPTTSTSEVVHAPRLVVPDSCIDGCKKLKRDAADLLLQSVAHPDQQNDIICSGKSKILRTCGARAINAGDHNQSFGDTVPGETGHFLINPVFLETYGSTDVNYMPRLADALEHGATEHSIHEL